ncbi:hypothetical protein Pan216_22670 [Planctomycetes bacterium Pan216]|uniref:Uncharacterized protein n=1 Tax=Kolteria novifilia TaxID=2527975 RepID=A0A518B347_9BACT|nr:hypothetical protein Pan216_22670 [Planctomycetes bacterium Pan216]
MRVLQILNLVLGPLHPDAVLQRIRFEEWIEPHPQSRLNHIVQTSNLFLFFTCSIYSVTTQRLSRKAGKNLTDVRASKCRVLNSRAPVIHYRWTMPWKQDLSVRK